MTVHSSNVSESNNNSFSKFSASKSGPFPGSGLVSCFPHRNVLLAEDEDRLLYSYTLSLELMGFNVIAASNGSQALEKFYANRGRIGLIILDILMPYLNGIEILEKVRELDKQTPVILISGYGEGLIGIHENLWLNTAFLPKPFSANELEKSIFEFVSRSAPFPDKEK